MVNSFDADVAMDVGVNAAIIYQNIRYWCEHNRTNDTNEHDGLFWTFNSAKAFSEQFPYLSEKQIRAALKILEEKGYIKTGNFNNSSYDRTKWYADLKGQMQSDKRSGSICPTGQMQSDKRSDSMFPTGKMELPSRENGISPEGRPIPNINTNINTDINISKKESKGDSSFDDILESYSVISGNEELKNAFMEFIKMRKLIKAPLTNQALKLNINKAIELSGNNPEQMQKIVQQSVMNSWKGMFPIKEECRASNKSEPVGNPFTRLKEKEGMV